MKKYCYYFRIISLILVMVMVISGCSSSPPNRYYESELTAIRYENSRLKHQIDVLQEEIGALKEETIAIKKDENNLKIENEALSITLTEFEASIADEEIRKLILVSIENALTIEDFMEVFFSNYIESDFDDEFEQKVYDLYQQLEFKGFIKGFSVYSKTIVNHISSYLVYSLASKEGGLDDLLADIEGLGSEKEYSYFSKRMKEDSQLYLTQSEAYNRKLHFEDDAVQNPEDLFEIIDASNTIEKLMDVYFEYAIDGAYAEQVGIELYQLYRQMPFDEFVEGFSKYGEVVQKVMADLFVYHVSYYNEEGLRQLEEDMIGLEKKTSYEYFLNQLKETIEKY